MSASRIAMIATVSTATRPITTSCFCGGGDLRNTLYRSSTRAEELTISWLEMVLMIAATTAARMRPAMNGCSSVCDMTSTTVSGSARSMPLAAM